MSEVGKYPSVVAAKYLKALAKQDGHILNMTQLQKLLFIAYGNFLAENNEILLDEQPKAWPYGPVFPRVRKKVPLDTINSLDEPDFSEIIKDKITTDIFKNVIKKYSSFSAGQLSEWSHSKGSPWDLTISRPDFIWNQSIPNEYTKDYFSKIDV